MKKINYANKEIKEQISDLKTKVIVRTILEELFRMYENILITDVSETSRKYIILFQANEINYKAEIDYIYRRLVITNDKINYSMHYHIDANSSYPLGKGYQYNHQTVFLKETNDKHFHLFNYYNGKNKYTISILNDKENINEELIVNLLLSCNFENQDLTKFIDELRIYVKLEDTELTIKRDDDSIIKIQMGVLTNYVQYRTTEDYNEKVYLDKGEFIREVTYHEKVNDFVMPNIKVLKKEK